LSAVVIIFSCAFGVFQAVYAASKEHGGFLVIFLLPIILIAIIWVGLSVSVPIALAINSQDKKPVFVFLSLVMPVIMIGIVYWIASGILWVGYGDDSIPPGSVFYVMIPMIWISGFGVLARQSYQRDKLSGKFDGR
jgi:hypothetical protein